MASSLRRVRSDFAVPVAAEPKRFTRIDKQELALEAVARHEKNMISADRPGRVRAKIVVIICYFSACADYGQALDDAAKDARTTCEDGGILGAPGYNNSFPICNAESDYWQECGLRISTPGGIAYNDANANHSNYPYPAYQNAIGAPYCLVECTMRLCCASLQASDPKSSLKQAIKNCRKKFG